jgi:Carboxypeptidase regulatory-like domain
MRRQPLQGQAQDPPSKTEGATPRQARGEPAAGARVRWVALLLMLLAVCAHQVAGQIPKKEKETQLRTVSGTVADKSGNPVQNAVVFLKNSRTNIVLSHFTDEKGEYKFSGLDPNVDYEIHAEQDDQKSATKNMSALDSRKEITLNLKLDRKKS